MTLLGNPTRKRGIRRIFLAYASGYQVFKQHQFVPAALGLSASGSVMLLATTNKLCIDVATVPFLWILPLSLYLITFILCFDNPRWYDRRVSGLLLSVAAPAAC